MESFIRKCGCFPHRCKNEKGNTLNIFMLQELMRREINACVYFIQDIVNGIGTC